MENKYRSIGVSIIKNDRTMSTEDVVTDLNRLAFVESELADQKKTAADLSIQINELKSLLERAVATIKNVNAFMDKIGFDK